jgi:hypothetical protein
VFPLVVDMLATTLEPRQPRTAKRRDRVGGRATRPS